MAGAGGKEVGRVSIRVVPNLDKFRAELKAELEAIEKSFKVKIPVEFDVNRAALTKALDKIKNEKIVVQIDAQGVTREVEKAVDDADKTIDLEPEVSERPWTLFRDRMKRDLDKLMTEIEPRIPLDVDGEALREDVYYKIADLDGRIGALKLDLDIPESEKAKIVAEIAALDALVPDLTEQGSGSGGLFQALGDIGLRGENLGILLAALALGAPVIALISGALTSLPGIIAGIMTPIGAVMLGLDGIKAAAERARPAFENLRKEVSDVFEQGMASGFDTIKERLIPGITLPMKNMAGTLSDMFNGVVETISSPENLNLLQSTIDNISQGFRNAIPGLNEFSEGLLGLADSFAQKFPGLGDTFSKWGDSFSNWVDKVSKDGSLDRALENLGAVGGELGGLAGDILKQGFEWLQDPEFATKMKEFVADIRVLVNELMPLMKGLFLEIADITGRIASDIKTIKSIGDLDNKPGEEDSGDGFKSWKDGIGDRLKSAAENIPGLGKVGFATIQGGFNNILFTINTIKNTLKGVFTEWVAEAGVAFPQLVAKFSQLAPQIGAAMQGIPAVVGAILSNLPSVVATHFSGMVAAARSALANMVSEAIIGCAEFVAQMVNGGANAAAEVRSWPAKLVAELAILVGQFEQAGRDATEGFIRGLGSLIDKARTVASDLGHAALEALKFAINSRSPSREFMKLGNYSSEGYAIGIEQSTDQAVNKIKEMARAVFEALKETFGSAEGINLNLNFGDIAGTMDQVSTAATGMQKAFSPSGGFGGGTGKVDDATKAEIDKLKQEQEYLDYQRQALKVQMNQTGDQTLKQQMDALKYRRDEIGLQIQQLQYASKYSEQTSDMASKYQEMAKTGIGMPFDFANATISQFQQDLGMSGGGLMGAAMGYGMDFAKSATGSIFNFNVSNVDDAISIKNNQINKDAAAIVGRS